MPVVEKSVDPQRVILVTGMSGAGKSEAMKVLEDLGYEAIDNLPIYLFYRLLAPEDGGYFSSKLGALAINVDMRTRGFDPRSFLSELETIRLRKDIALKLVFIDCNDERLRRRYTETRRRHPLASDRPVIDGIAKERLLMAYLRDSADELIDTSYLEIPHFRRLLTERFKIDLSSEMTVTVTSFSYRRGLPREADIVFDVRFLSNPFYVEKLRPQNGTDRDVAAYIKADPAFNQFFDALSNMITQLLPHYVREGKSYLTVAIGCTGGRHRSVYVAESLAEVLGQRGQLVGKYHRDLYSEKPTDSSIN